MSREIEKPLLDSVYFRERKFKAGLPNKKNRIPRLDGIHLQSLMQIQFLKNFEEPEISLCAAPNTDEKRFVQNLHNQNTGTLIFPIGTRPDDYVFSRFIAKVGLEALAFR